MKKFKLSEIQANHILDMPLRRLTRLAREELESEHKELLAKIKYLNVAAEGPEEAPRRHQGGARSRSRRSSPTRGAPQIKADEGELDVEDLIAEEDVVITVSRAGYVKRQPDRHLPPAGPRRQGHPRGEPQGRGRRQRRLHHDHAPLAAVLHQPGARSTA